MTAVQAKRIADLEAELEAFRGKPSGKDDVATAVELLHEWKARAEKAEAELAEEIKKANALSFWRDSYKAEIEQKLYIALQHEQGEKARAEKAEAEVDHLRSAGKLCGHGCEVCNARIIIIGDLKAEIERLKAVMQNPSISEGWRNWMALQLSGRGARESGEPGKLSASGRQTTPRNAAPASAAAEPAAPRQKLRKPGPSQRNDAEYEWEVRRGNTQP